MRQADSDLSPGEESDLSPTAEDAAKGAVGGGIIGGLAGLLTATGIVAIPGLAPLLAGGALISLLGTTGASIVAGSGVGAVAGGLVGALVSINVPETAARQYEEAVREGKILITVRTDGTRRGFRSCSVCMEQTPGYVRDRLLSGKFQSMHPDDRALTNLIA